MGTSVSAGRLRVALLAVVAAASGLWAPAALRADEGTVTRPLTVALSANIGLQYDDRPCLLAGREGTTPDTPVCLLFAGGADLALLWRGRLGGAVGIFSSAGQAVTTGKAAAIPDRVSLPFVLEVRPLAFLPGADAAALRARLLSGLALRLGPSLEIVRTSSDSAVGAGLYLGLAGEVPLTAARRNAVSLRVQLHVTAVPIASLNDGMVRTLGSGCEPTPDCLSIRSQGYGAIAQTYVGLVYYP